VLIGSHLLTCLCVPTHFCACSALVDSLEGLRNVHYCPLVLNANRSAFEASIRSQYNITDFQIREATFDAAVYDAYVPRGVHAEYLPKIVAAKGPYNFAAAGFDMYSEPGRTEATNRARASNALIATEPVRLLNTPWYGLALVAPAYDAVQPRGALESAVVPGQPLTAAQWSGLRFSGVLAAGIILSEPMATVTGQTRGVDALLLEDVTALVNRTYGSPSLWVPCSDATAATSGAGGSSGTGGSGFNATQLGSSAASLARSSACTASLKNRCGFVCPIPGPRGFGGGLLVSAVRVSAANSTKVGAAGSAADSGAMPFASGGSNLGVSVSNVAASVSAELSAAEAAAVNDAALSVDPDLTSSWLFSMGGRTFSLTVVASAAAALGPSRVLYSLIIGSACAVALVASLVTALLLHWSGQAERQRRAEHKQAEASARAAAEAHQRTVDLFHHELLNPAHHAASMCEMLSESLPRGNTAARQDAAAATQAVKGIVRLLNDVADLSSMRQGHLKLRPAVMAPAQVLGLVARVHQAFASVPISLVVDRSVPAALLADSARFQQLVSIGLSNAVKATFAGAILITVSAAAAAEADDSADGGLRRPAATTAAHLQIRGPKLSHQQSARRIACAHDGAPESLQPLYLVVRVVDTGVGLDDYLAGGLVSPSAASASEPSPSGGRKWTRDGGRGARRRASAASSGSGASSSSSSGVSNAFLEAAAAYQELRRQHARSSSGLSSLAAATLRLGRRSAPVQPALAYCSANGSAKAGPALTVQVPLDPASAQQTPATTFALGAPSTSLGQPTHLSICTPQQLQAAQGGSVPGTHAREGAHASDAEQRFSAGPSPHAGASLALYAPSRAGGSPHSESLSLHFAAGGSAVAGSGVLQSPSSPASQQQRQLLQPAESGGAARVARIGTAPSARIATPAGAQTSASAQAPTRLPSPQAPAGLLQYVPYAPSVAPTAGESISTPGAGMLASRSVTPLSPISVAPGAVGAGSDGMGAHLLVSVPQSHPGWLQMGYRGAGASSGASGPLAHRTASAGRSTSSRWSQPLSSLLRSSLRRRKGGAAAAGGGLVDGNVDAASLRSCVLTDVHDRASTFDTQDSSPNSLSGSGGSERSLTKGAGLGLMTAELLSAAMGGCIQLFAVPAGAAWDPSLALLRRLQPAAGSAGKDVPHARALVQTRAVLQTLAADATRASPTAASAVLDAATAINAIRRLAGASPVTVYTAIMAVQPADVAIAGKHTGVGVATELGVGLPAAAKSTAQQSAALGAVATPQPAAVGGPVMPATAGPQLLLGRAQGLPPRPAAAGGAVTAVAAAAGYPAHASGNVAARMGGAPLAPALLAITLPALRAMRLYDSTSEHEIASGAAGGLGAAARLRNLSSQAAPGAQAGQHPTTRSPGGSALSIGDAAYQYVFAALPQPTQTAAVGDVATPDGWSVVTHVEAGATPTGGSVGSARAATADAAAACDAASPMVSPAAGLAGPLPASPIAATFNAAGSSSAMVAWGITASPPVAEAGGPASPLPLVIDAAGRTALLALDAELRQALAEHALSAPAELSRARLRSLRLHEVSDQLLRTQQQQRRSPGGLQQQLLQLEPVYEEEAALPGSSSYSASASPSGSAGGSRTVASQTAITRTSISSASVPGASAAVATAKPWKSADAVSQSAALLIVADIDAAAACGVAGSFAECTPPAQQGESHAVDNSTAGDHSGSQESAAVALASPAGPPPAAAALLPDCGTDVPASAMAAATAPAPLLPQAAAPPRPLPPASEDALQRCLAPSTRSLGATAFLGSAPPGSVALAAPGIGGGARGRKAALAAPVGADGEPLRPLRVLYVDDEAVNRRIMQRHLEALHCSHIGLLEDGLHLPYALAAAGMMSRQALALLPPVASLSLPLPALLARAFQRVMAQAPKPAIAPAGPDAPGAAAAAAVAAAEAQQLCATALPVDVVLLDLVMVHSNGQAVCRALRSVYGLTDVPIIAVTANAHGIEGTLLRAGFDAVVAKPFGLAAIQRHIAAIRAGRRSADDGLGA
jgi:CheY-like chemotaxis protein/signal transduction histidine kinase